MGWQFICNGKYNIFKTEYKIGLTLSREGAGIELVSYQPIDIMPEMDILWQWYWVANKVIFV